MKREIYNLVMCNISAYYMAIVKLNEMKVEAYSLKGISETAINKGISGNAGYQNKINECVVFEKSIKEKFQAVSDTESATCHCGYSVQHRNGFLRFKSRMVQGRRQQKRRI